ncbi:helix-turn-helix domain-containing protein [Microvirga lotononidis]
MDLTRALTVAKREKSPPRPDRLLVLSAVALGAIEGRPFRVQKLAEYLGMPRTSVLRRLEELGEEGWIEYDAKGHALIRADRLNEPGVVWVCDRMSTLIHRAHYELLELERKENKTVQSGH